MQKSLESKDEKISFNDFKNEVLKDYRIACRSRQLSILGRKEVLTGKAKFGIFGDGKELVQLAMAKNYRNGDWRSGYYRDQTWMMAAGLFTMEEFFLQLYGVTDVKLNPGNGGRNFNNHFSTRSLTEKGEWKDLTLQKNSAADISPTAGQMPRMLGLGLASKLFRQNSTLHSYNTLSNQGNEIVFGSIGDASTSEGHFFEIMNSAAIKQIPLAMVVYDDGYGISVEKKVQTVKSSISEALKGFEKTNGSNGILIYKAKGWNYPELCKTFKEGVERCRNEHVPVLFHIEELTQPQGHSTSGSHERYKSSARLEWEQAHDPIIKMEEWIVNHEIASEKELAEISSQAGNEALAARDTAWVSFQKPIKKERDSLLSIIEGKGCQCHHEQLDKIAVIAKNLRQLKAPIRRDVTSAAKKVLRHICSDCPKRSTLQEQISAWLNQTYIDKHESYSAHLYSESEFSSLNVETVAPEFGENPKQMTGREILRDNFAHLMEKYPLMVAFGEDVGKIGGVNQTWEGLQDRFGTDRVFDTGIRETSIIGKGIGLALRGFRPLAEIQYFDYLLYGLQTISDDLATTHWRTAAGQTAPLIISTRGHRLEGVWHSGSPLSMVINSIRGVYVCVPRNMTQAAGFYNTLMEGQDPALVIEPLNGYRLKENYPENLGEFKIPLGVPEIITSGNDITLVTYGSCVRIAQDAVKQLSRFGISVELIDVQTLLPFDVYEVIAESVKKTHKVVFFDEDVPGGATAFMMQKVLEEQDAYNYLEAPPRTLSAKEHRPAYTSDGDYYSNPNAENVFELIYDIMSKFEPSKYPKLY